MPGQREPLGTMAAERDGMSVDATSIGPGRGWGPTRLKGGLALAAWVKSSGARYPAEPEVASKFRPSTSVAGSSARPTRIAALNHPYICTLYDVGPDYLVMELVEGDARRRADGGPAPGRGAAHRGADRRSARSGARARNHSSRSEAGATSRSGRRT